MRVQGRPSGASDWLGKHVFLHGHGRADESADIDAGDNKYLGRSDGRGDKGIYMEIKSDVG